MIPIHLQRYQGYLSGCEEQLATGQLHIVCPALNGMTNLNVFACLFGKMTLEEVHTVADRVNTTRVSETLHPTVPVSLLPLHRGWQDAQIGPSKDFGKTLEIDKNIRECLRIHQEIVNCPTLLFALDQGNVFDRHLAISRLDYILRSEPLVRHLEVCYDLAP